MNRIYIALIWIIISIIFVGYVYAATFGTSTFGADVFGTGTTTTSVYSPGYNRTIIIGGGLVSLDREYRPQDIMDTEIMLYDKLIMEDEKWVELQD